jgi:hypothetical protein
MGTHNLMSRIYALITPVISTRLAVTGMLGYMIRVTIPALQNREGIRVNNKLWQTGSR